MAAVKLSPSDEEYAELVQAAGTLPPTTWAWSVVLAEIRRSPRVRGWMPTFDAVGREDPPLFSALAEIAAASRGDGPFRARAMALAEEARGARPDRGTRPPTPKAGR